MHKRQNASNCETISKTIQRNSHLFKVKSTNKCYYFKIAIPFLLTKMILVTFQAKMLHAFGHATLFSHASDTICSKDKNEESYNSFPTFWGKKMKFTIHLSLFTITIHCYYSPVTVHSEILPI